MSGLGLEEGKGIDGLIREVYGVGGFLNPSQNRRRSDAV